MTLFQAIREELAATFGPRRVSISGAARKKPTKVERMLLIAAAAQLLAGPGKNPTRAQLVAATRGVDRKLASGTSMSGSSSMGSFWSKVASLAKQSGGAAVRAAPAAAQWVAKNPQIVLPIAAGAVASPFLISAITAAAKSKQAMAEATASPPPPPEGETVTAVAPAAPAAAPEEPGAMSMGLWQGWDETSRMHGLTEEEAALGECGGASERAALMRTHSVLGEEISHDAYRASVMHNARRLAGGAPGTKHIFLAEKMVKGKLRRNGIDIQIPGAAPGRRTL